MFFWFWFVFFCLDFFVWGFLFGWLFFSFFGRNIYWNGTGKKKKTASRGCFSNWRLKLKTSGEGPGHGKLKGFGRILFLQTWFFFNILLDFSIFGKSLVLAWENPSALACSTSWSSWFCKVLPGLLQLPGKVVMDTLFFSAHSPQCHCLCHYEFSIN